MRRKYYFCKKLLLVVNSKNEAEMAENEIKILMYDCHE